MPGLNAGALDRVVDIEQNSAAVDGSGAVTESWSAFLSNVRAEKRDRTGRQRMQGDAVSGELDTIWRIHWRSGVTPAMRVNHGGDLYDIKHVAELGRREGLELHCTRVVT